VRFLALAADYDGTLAHDGRVPDETVDALRRAREAGHRLIMVTGRVLPQLHEVFPHLDLFDRIVAENGALLYDPATTQERLLAPEPPEDLTRGLRDRGVPVDVGRVVIATAEPFGTTCFEVIHALGYEHDIFFNKGSIMILPSGISKGSGLDAALRDLDVSPHNVVCVGDAENDHSLLRAGEARVAVANALPSLKEEADWVTPGERGRGVVQLIDQMLEDDLAALSAKLSRHDIPIGKTDAGEEVTLPSYGHNILIAGTSGGGKSSLVTALIERLAQRCFQFCVVDPEGDYETVDFAIQIGTTDIRPDEREILTTLVNPRENVIVNLLAVPLSDRPSFFEHLLTMLEEMRTRTAHPHFVVVDEAHHMLPRDWEPAPETLPLELRKVIFVTTRPDIVSPAVLRTVKTVLAVGDNIDRTIADFCSAQGLPAPSLPSLSVPHGRAIRWTPSDPDQVIRFTVAPSSTKRHRHIRKYAFGDLGPESFHFRGPEQRLNLRARNLQTFIDLAKGVDDATWLYHLRRHDYSHWVREMVKDPDLAYEIADVENNEALNPQESRNQISQAIEHRYTAPAGTAP